MDAGTTIALPASSLTLSAACRQTLLGQRTLSELSSNAASASASNATEKAKASLYFSLWLTHSEVVPAKEQCAQLANVRRELPWVREGDDITDCSREGGPASCVRCNITST